MQYGKDQYLLFNPRERRREIYFRVTLTQLMLINVIMENEQILKKVIAAEGEHKASRALKHAAEVIADSPAALQVVLFLIFSLLSAVSSTHRLFQIICHSSK